MTPISPQWVVFAMAAGLMYSSQVHFLQIPIVQILVRKKEDEKNLLCPKLRNSLPGLAVWMAVSSLAASVSWLQLYICFNIQMPIINDL